MSDQEQIAALRDVILGVTWPDGGHDGFPTKKIADMLAEQLVRAGFGSVEAAKAEADRWHSAALEAAAGESRAEAALATAKAEALEEAAIEVQRAKPFHPTRNYTPVDQAYDDAARLLRDRAARLRGEGE